MKSLLVLVLTLCFSVQSMAATLYASNASIAYGATNLTTTVYIQLVAALPKSTKGIMISNTGANAVMIALGGAGSEVNQLIIPPLASGGTPIFMPMSVSQGQRVSAIALTGTISAGNLNVNFIYN